MNVNNLKCKVIIFWLSLLNCWEFRRLSLIWTFLDGLEFLKSIIIFNFHVKISFFKAGVKTNLIFNSRQVRAISKIWSEKKRTWKCRRFLLFGFINSSMKQRCTAVIKWCPQSFHTLTYVKGAALPPATSFRICSLTRVLSCVSSCLHWDVRRSGHNQWCASLPFHHFWFFTIICRFKLKIKWTSVEQFNWNRQI